MRMPKCPGIPERVGVEVIDEHQFAARIADDLSRNGSDRSLNLVGSAAFPVPLETPTRWGEGPAVRILFPPAASPEKLWVWRGDEGGARYRLGLKELASRLATGRADAVTRAHARLAGLCLDAVVAICGSLEGGEEPDAPDEHALRGLFALLPGLVTLAGSETLQQRYATLPVTKAVFDVEARQGDRSAPSCRQITWYSAILSASHHGAGPPRGNPERREFDAGAHLNRGNAKQDVPWARRNTSHDRGRD
jgi:hypothetical protein